MALQAWMSIVGTKQGEFKSETTSETRKYKWIPLLTFSCSGRLPYDPAHHAITGNRQWNPITVVKQWGAASPQILTAMTTAELLEAVNFEFERVAADGTTVVYQTVTLVNATIIAVNQSTADASSPQPAPPENNLSELEEIQFIFRKIEIQNQDGPTSLMDSW
jgi:type VI secretion system secreted protein Hcp